MHRTSEMRSAATTASRNLNPTTGSLSHSHITANRSLARITAIDPSPEFPVLFLPPLSYHWRWQIFSGNRAEWCPRFHGSAG